MGGCAAFPVSEGWSNISHEKIVSYVSAKHGNDWAPYLVKWNKQLHTMKSVYARDGVAVFKKKALTLKGEALQRYIEDIAARIEVTECLARYDAETREARALNDLDTAAGGNAQ